ncbi:MAG: Wadjet anti-phage system protein JetD domain-containing protein, partial [Tunicatimonas sp.]
LSLLSTERKHHFQQFEAAVALIREQFPPLEGWMPGNEKKLGEYGPGWADLLRVGDWFLHHYVADRYYIRELPIRVHTKFVEQHKPILNELLSYLLPPHQVRDDFVGNREHNFEKRFGLKYDESLIRVRTLNRNGLPGLNDLSIRHSAFAQTPWPEAQGIITENKMNFLTLPALENTFAIFGGGFNIHLLRHAEWLKHKRLYYWGDLDAHGFIMLAQLRQLFAHVESLMMDRATFDAFYVGDHGPLAANVSTDGLREDEQKLFYYLKENNLRLEQEKIPHWYVLAQLRQLTPVSEPNDSTPSE